MPKLDKGIGMRAFRFLRIAAAALVLITALAPVSHGYADLPDIDVQSRSAILVYAQTGEILYSHNINIRREPASLTKMLTVLLAVEYAEKIPGGFDQTVTAEDADFADITIDSSTAGILPGEQLRLEDLLYCAMVRSANEACNIIARHVAGSREDFVALMNTRLEELGCTESRFSNTHGLPHEEHYTTAYDMYLLSKACMQSKKLMEIAHTETYTVPPTNLTPEGRTFSNTNRLLNSRMPEYSYPYARGIKTGSTAAAGYCLASVAEKGGKALICVVMGASAEEETGIIRSFTETRELYEWGFDNFEVKTILKRGELVASNSVELGLDYDEVALEPDKPIEALVPVYLDPADITRDIKLYYPEGIKAPVARGQVLGEITLSYEGHVYGTSLLLANKKIDENTQQVFVENVTDVFSQDWIKYAIAAAIGLVVVYAVIVVVYNVRKQRTKSRPSGNYRGRKRGRFR